MTLAKDRLGRIGTSSGRKSDRRNLSDLNMEKNMYKEFLNPKSMLTPGIAGSLTMLITNTLASQFSLPPNYTGLVISFMFGLVVLVSTVTIAWLRIVLYILNSLLIFSVALGTNHVGAGVAKPVRVSNDNLVSDPAIGSPFLAYVKLSVSKAFFPNWLDGTVPRRKELLSTVAKLNDEEAKKVLSVLGIDVKDLGNMKTALEKTVEFARTADQINQLEAAVNWADNATQKKWNSEYIIREKKGPGE